MHKFTPAQKFVKTPACQTHLKWPQGYRLYISRDLRFAFATPLLLSCIPNPAEQWLSKREEHELEGAMCQLISLIDYI